MCCGKRESARVFAAAAASAPLLVTQRLAFVVGYIAQWLERLTADQEVPGPNPGVPSGPALQAWHVGAAGCKDGKLATMHITRGAPKHPSSRNSFVEKPLMPECHLGT